MSQANHSRHPGRPSGSRDTHPRARRSRDSDEYHARKPEADIGEISYHQQADDDFKNSRFDSPSKSVLETEIPENGRKAGDWQDVDISNVIIQERATDIGLAISSSSLIDPFHDDWPHWS